MTKVYTFFWGRLYRNIFNRDPLPCLDSLYFQVPSVERSHRGWTLLYGLLAGSLTLSKVLAVRYIPVSTTECLEMTTNLVTAPVLNRVLASEKPSLLTMLYVLLCCCGVVFIIQPPGLFPNTTLSTLNIGSLISEACDVPAEHKDLFEETVNILTTEKHTHVHLSLTQLPSLLHSANSSFSFNALSCDESKLEQIEYYSHNAWLGMYV